MKITTRKRQSNPKYPLNEHSLLFQDYLINHAGHSFVSARRYALWIQYKHLSGNAQPSRPAKDERVAKYLKEFHKHQALMVKAENEQPQPTSTNTDDYIINLLSTISNQLQGICDALGVTSNN